MSPINVLIVDDHELVREILARYLDDLPDVHVTASVGDCTEAVALSRQHAPDVILFDVDMPGLSPFDAARTIRRAQPDVRVLFLSAFTNDHYIEQALKVGAIGYLTKGEPPHAVADAIRRAVLSRVSFSDAVRSRLVLDTDGVHLRHGEQRSRRSELSDRELEVLAYLARGMSKKQIGETMSLSVKTIERHTQNIMNKLDIHDRVELALYAVREGIAEL